MTRPLEPHPSHWVRKANYLDSLEVLDFDSGLDRRRLHHNSLILKAFCAPIPGEGVREPPSRENTGDATQNDYAPSATGAHLIQASVTRLRPCASSKSERSARPS